MNKRLKIGIVVSEFNEVIGERLLKGCLAGLKEQKIKEEQIILKRVPGAFEIPLAALNLITQQKCEVVIALGCVIKGKTDHYEHVCRTCTDGLMQVQLTTGIPVVYEVLMVKELKQAISRSEGQKEDNKGYIAAKVAMKMVE